MRKILFFIDNNVGLFFKKNVYCSLHYSFIEYRLSRDSAKQYFDYHYTNQMNIRKVQN